MLRLAIGVSDDEKIIRHYRSTKIYANFNRRENEARTEQQINLQSAETTMSIHFFNPDDIDNDDREAMVDVSVEGAPGREIPKNRWFVVRRGLCWDEVDDNIRQPDPGRLVLCACIHDYGCICYGYHDEIKAWSRTTLIFAVVFAILTTPLALLCFLPALCFLKKVF